MPIKGYEYGLLPPITNAELVLDQMRKAHRYRNVLVEIERERRDKIRAIMGAHPDMGPLEEQLQGLVALRDAARAEILATRKLTRTLSRTETTLQRARIGDLAKQIKQLREQMKAQRKAIAADETIRAQFKEAEERARQRVRDARAACAVYWGTYLLQEADADAARASKMPPKFVPWRGEGRVSVQLQGGVSLEELFGQDTQVHIEPVPPEAHSMGSARGTRRRLSRTTLWIRVGSAKGKPIWATWPMVLHRPLPPGSRIKVATVSRRRKDCRTWQWRLHLTVDMPADTARAVPAGGILALNMGFCLRPDDTVRAGYLVGDDGFEHEIVLPPSVGDAVRKSDSIRSIRDKNMDEMRPKLVEWFAQWKDAHQRVHDELVALIAQRMPSANGFERLQEYVASGGPALPYWLAQRTEHVYAWRSAARFRTLCFDWRRQRFLGDDDGYEILEAYRYRDEHLERYETNMRRRALLRRREAYRSIAAQMARRYRMLVIDDTDLREFQKSPAPESVRVEIPAVKFNQRLAAGSQLRGVFLNAFGEGRTAKRSARDNTRRCNACGTINQWDRVTAGRLHTCSNPDCKQSWDQDANNCKNLIADHRRDAMAEAAPASSATPAPVSRSQRLRSRKGQPGADPGTSQ